MNKCASSRLPIDGRHHFTLPSLRESPKCLIIALVITILALLIVQGCSRDDLKRKLKIGGPKNISMLPIIADKKGFFTQVGLDYELQNIQTGKIAMDAVLSGNIDIGIIVETNVAFIKFQEHADIQILASVMKKQDDAIVARRDRGITAVEDLRGKKVGFLPATTSHVYLERLLESHGLSMTDIEGITMTPPSMQAAVISGDVDAVSVWQPFRYNALQELQERAIEFKETSVYTAYSLAATSKEFAKDHAESLKKFLLALKLAEEFVSSHPDEAITILADEVGMNNQTLTSVWNEYELRLSLDEALIALIREEGHWIKRSQEGFENKSIPTYDDVVASEFLRSIMPERVKVN